MKKNDKILKKISKHFMLLFICGSLFFSAFAQTDVKIFGRVIDDKGEAIIGASIAVNGMQIGTITDYDGNFTIDIPAGSTLSVSSLGYVTQQVKTSGVTELTIVLQEDLQLLDEVVVIGYGTARKSDLTGAVVRADLSALKNSPNVSLAQGLKGVVPGLNIGTSTTAGRGPSVSIRGQNSISGTNNPLIVLDGVIYRGDLININPSDIESIDVLKDASSAAIYGSQAANGVLLITTKSMKNLSKPVVEYSTNISFQQILSNNMRPLRRNGYLRQLEHADLSNSRIGPDLVERDPNWNIEGLFIRPSVAAGYKAGTDIDWWGLMTEELPYIQDHTVSLKGKSELAGYYLSFGFLDQKNLLKNDTYKRYNIRINMDATVTDWLTLGTQSFFSINDYSGQNPSYGEIIPQSALSSPYDENGELLKLTDMGLPNPLLYINNPNNEMVYNLTGSFFVDIEIPFVKGLNYRSNYSRNLTFFKNFGFDPYASTLQGRGYKNNSSSNLWSLDHILTYKRQFNLHAINATLVYGVEKRDSEHTNASATDFKNKSLGYHKMDAARQDLNSITSGAFEESSLYSMGRAVYTYNDRYITTVTIRRDGYSGFGADNKFGYFPSAALAWRISEESFLKNKVNWVDNLKTRISYGANGNRVGSAYSTLASMTTGSLEGYPAGYLFGDNAVPELTQALFSMSNWKLKWESTAALNLGLDFGLLNGRIFGNYEFYRSKTSNLLYNIPIPFMNGVPTNNIISNIGKLQNTGHEFSITGVPIQKKDFSWQITLNFSSNRNKVLTVLGVDADKDGKEDDLTAARIFIDHPLGVVYDYRIIGMWQLEDYYNGDIPNGFTYGTYKILDIDGDGNYTGDKDREILGYTAPAYRFSIRNLIKYKDFELNFFINSAQGGSNYFYGQPLQHLQIPRYMRDFSWFGGFDYWLPENPNARYQQLGAYVAAVSQSGNSFHPYQQRNFIRLQEVSLAYNVPKLRLRKLGVNHARIFISGTNLLTITKWDGWDPESGAGIGAGYPTLKNYSMGLNFEF